MAYKYLNRSAVLEHLQEGQTVNIDEYIEKLRFFKKYTDSHYFKYDTLIKFFEDFKQRNHTKRILITFNKNHRLQCEPVQD